MLKISHTLNHKELMHTLKYVSNFQNFLESEPFFFSYVFELSPLLCNSNHPEDSLHLEVFLLDGIDSSP